MSFPLLSELSYNSPCYTRGRGECIDMDEDRSRNEMILIFTNSQLQADVLSNKSVDGNSPRIVVQRSQQKDIREYDHQHKTA
jgi:hypothetical protein